MTTGSRATVEEERAGRNVRIDCVDKVGYALSKLFRRSMVCMFSSFGCVGIPAFAIVPNTTTTTTHPPTTTTTTTTTHPYPSSRAYSILVHPSKPTYPIYSYSVSPHFCFPLLLPAHLTHRRVLLVPVDQVQELHVARDELDAAVLVLDDGRVAIEGVLGRVG